MKIEASARLKASKARYLEILMKSLRIEGTPTHIDDQCAIFELHRYPDTSYIRFLDQHAGPHKRGSSNTELIYTWTGLTGVGLRLYCPRDMKAKAHLEIYNRDEAYANIVEASTDYSFSVLEPHLEHSHWQAIVDGNPNLVEAADIWKTIRDAGFMKVLDKLINQVRNLVNGVAAELNLEVSQIMDAFKSKPMFGLFKALKFSLKTLIAPLKALADLYRKGVMNVFMEIHKSGMFQKLHDGAISVDEFLDKYPMLRKLAGPAVAGLLIWMFLSGNYTYHPDMDMDLVSIIKAALAGSWSAAELFTSPQGLMAIALLLTGLAAPWPSPAWLNSGMPFNVLIAMCYTAYRHMPIAQAKANLQVIKTKIKFAKVS